MAPYVLLILVGFLPSEVWRIAGVLIGRSIPADSALLEWVRLVAMALLAAVVAKLLMSPNGALAAAPIWGRFGGVAAGFGGFFLFRRSLIAGVLCGEAVLVSAAWWAGG
jgi:hypothetical protein